MFSNMEVSNPLDKTFPSVAKGMLIVMKKILLLALVFILTLTIAINAQQNLVYIQEVKSQEYEDTSVENSVKESHLTEFMEIVSSLIIEKEAARALGVRRRLPNKLANDVRFYDLSELSDIIQEARTIQRKMQGNEQLLPIVIIILGEPNNRHDKFRISFSSEIYFELIDFISEFTGITKDEIEVDVRPIGYVGGGPDICEDLRAKIEALGWSFWWEWE